MGVIGALCWRQGEPGLDDVVQNAPGNEMFWNYNCDHSFSLRISKFSSLVNPPEDALEIRSTSELGIATSNGVERTKLLDRHQTQ